MTNLRRSLTGVWPVLLLAWALGGCGRDDGFNTRSAEAFAGSCIARAGELAARLNAVQSKTLPVDTALMASLFAASVDLPPQVSIDRDFDPNTTIPVAGFIRTGEVDAVKSCVLAAGGMETLAQVSPAAALRLGITNVMASLSAEIDLVKSVRGEILSRQSNAKAEAIRLREAMDRYAPKGVTFRIASEDGRYVPSVSLDAANVVGRPITAFILTIRLVGADGVPIGAGRVKFVPPVPLGPGIESTYVLDLSGVRGIDTKAVVTYSGAVRIFIVLDDLFVEGKPMLQSLVIGPIDHARADALDALMNSMLRYRDAIRSVREREISASN